MNWLSYLMLILVVIENLVAAFLFAKWFERRELFYLRYIGFGLVAVVIVFWIQVIYVVLTGKEFSYGSPVDGVFDSIFNCLLYLMIFFMVFAVCWLSYKQTASQIFFCCSGAYAVQHMSKNIAYLFKLIPVDSDLVGNIVEIVVSVVVFLMICVITYYILIKPRKDESLMEGNQKNKIFVSLLVLLTSIAMSRLTVDNPERNLLSVVSESIYAILCCFLLLYIQFAIRENDNMKFAVDSMNNILQCERKQYELSKETIELINLKCHDMKHQISALRKNASEENIAEIERAIMIYGSNIKTGNDALDIILTEKKLYCDDKKIQMTCFVNCRDISFMSNVDIYSLFGNALSNAIESVSKVPDVQNRCINVNLTSIGTMLFVHIENYFKGQLTFENGLPVTDGSKDYHGFGLKSMERIAHKYGGEISVSVFDDKFNLDIVIPVPEAKE